MRGVKDGAPQERPLEHVNQKRITKLRRVWRS